MKAELKKLCIAKNMTIKKAMQQMDDTARKILFITNRSYKLLGTITDGDVRRWILSDGELQAPVSKIFNRQPIYIKRATMRKLTKKEILHTILDGDVRTVPIVDNTIKLVDVIFFNEFLTDDIKGATCSDAKIPLVIMAGGKGNRLDPFTRILPKALLPIGNKPVIEVIIEKMMQFTSGKIYFILGYKAEMIKSYFDNCLEKYPIVYINEGDIPCGTAGGLGLLPDDMGETFFLANCDTIIDAKYDDLYAFHKKRKNDITVIASMQHFEIPYGVISITRGGDLSEITEKPEHDFLVNTGMYVIEKSVLEYIPRKGKLFHMTELIDSVRKNKGKIGVYPISQKSWIDVGQWSNYKDITHPIYADE